MGPGRDQTGDIAEHWRTREYSDIMASRRPQEQALEVTATLPDARMIGVAGRDMSPFVGDEISAEIERCLAAPAHPPVPDRVLATILFTDIAGSTEGAASLGDQAWRDVLTSHRAEFAGRSPASTASNSTPGNGFFASFDGPARAIRCASTIVAPAAGQGLAVRAGVHTGECERTEGKLAGTT